MLFRENIRILKMPIFRPKSKAIAFAFSGKYSDFENAYFLEKSKATAFAFSQKYWDSENPYLLEKK